MKKTYSIIGLDCPNCAKKVERHLKKNTIFDNVEIDFINGSLFLEGNEKILDKDYICKEIAKIEDGITLKEKEKSTKKEKYMNKDSWILLVRITISALIIAIIESLSSSINNIAYIILYIFAYIIVSYDVIFKVFKNIFIKHKFFDENTLMFIATIGAIALQEYFEAVLVMLLSQVGEMLQHISIQKSKRTIVNTIDLRADKANLITNEGIEIISPEELTIGDVVLLKAGDCVPADGVIIDGHGSLDTASLTGESIPYEVENGSDVLSGMKVFEGTLKLKVCKIAYESTASKVMELVTESNKNKSKAEHFITKFATFYTPIVFIIALIIGIVVPIFNNQWTDFLHRALSFLVISCPCAIIISIPLAYFVAMGMAAKNGIIIKGGNYLDLLNEVDQVIFDKTGTITKGKFAVTDIVAIGLPKEELELYYYELEKNSNHPIANAIVETFSSSEDVKISDVKEIAGKGIQGFINGHKISIGNEKLMENVSNFKKISSNGTVIYLSKNDDFCGYIVVSDEIKESSKEFVRFLKKAHIKSVLLTGDRKENAVEVCNKLSIDEYHAECLPQDKLKILENEMTRAHKTMYIGDGINDAPSIARADIGVAMGMKGADIAVENADVIIMNDDLVNVEKAIKISKMTRKQAIFNISFALIVKLLVLFLALFNVNLGISNMIIAVLSDVGLSLFLVMITIFMGRRRVK